MLITTVKSSKISWIKNLNEANKAPVIGSLFLACIFMFPTLILQYFVELIFGDDPLFDLSFVFFLNTFFIHLFLKIVFDITVKFFFHFIINMVRSIDGFSLF